jgi:hypothetical protein
VNHELASGSSELGVTSRNGYVIQENVGIWVAACGGEFLIQQESRTFVWAALHNQKRTARWQSINGFALFDIETLRVVRN